MTRSAAGLAAVCLASLAPTGCMTGGSGSAWSMYNEAGEFSVRKALGWEEVKFPKHPNIPQADLKTAERVETLGRRIITQNTFTGIEPLFHTVGVPEAVLFHRGPDELFISEGLAKRCQTDAELAAVLCSELGQMAAERKAARRVGADRDSFPEVGLVGGTPGAAVGGGTADDPGRTAELAIQNRRAKQNAGGSPVDADALARDLLRGAGFEPGELDRVQPLLKQSDRGAALRKQMSGSAPAPTWDK